MQQINGITKVPYKGNNSDNLRTMQIGNAYKSNKWFTFVQSHNAGYKVKRGEQGVKLVRVIQVKNEKTGITEDRFVFFHVFNEEQLEKLKNKSDIKLEPKLYNFETDR